MLGRRWRRRQVCSRCSRPEPTPRVFLTFTKWFPCVLCAFRHVVPAAQVCVMERVLHAAREELAESNQFVQSLQAELTSAGANRAPEQGRSSVLFCSVNH